MINGRVTFFLHAARINFTASRLMKLVAFVRDFDPVLLSEVTVSSFAVQWYTSTATWLPVTVQTDEVAYTIPSGHKFKVTIVYHTDSDANGMLAYDTTTYNAFVMVPTAP